MKLAACDHALINAFVSLQRADSVTPVYTCVARVCPCSFRASIELMRPLIVPPSVVVFVVICGGYTAFPIPAPRRNSIYPAFQQCLDSSLQTVSLRRAFGTSELRTQCKGVGMLDRFCPGRFWANRHGLFSNQTLTDCSQSRRVALHFCSITGMMTALLMYAANSCPIHT